MEGKVVITGDATGLLSTMQKSSQAIRGFQSEAESSFGSIQSAVGGMQAKWVALGTTILGGAGFKQAVDTSVNLTKEANSLAKALGIDATQASILNVALGDIYQTKDTLLAASGKLTKTLKDNEEAFTNLGVKTRDQNGNFRNSLDIMLDVNGRLMQFKEGTDRNIEGMKIYGKQWGEVSGLLKLNTELMEESRKKAIALNLAVGQESVEATAKYRASMNDVEDVMTAVKKAIGDGVMPILTDLGDEFSASGPEKVEVMRKAIAILAIAFYGLKNGLEIVWTAIKTIIQSIVVALITMADVQAHALQFDFAGAKAAFTLGWEQIKDINKKGGEDIIAASVKSSEGMSRAIAQGFGPAKVTAAKPGAGGATSEGGEKKNKEDSLVAAWTAELEEIKLKEQEKAQIQGRFYQMSKEAEQQFWQSKRGLVEAGTKDDTALRKKMAETGLAVMRGQYEAEQEKLKTQLELAKNDYAQREVLAKKFSENAKQRFGAESKEYQEALKQQEQMRREHEEKMRAIDIIRLTNTRKMSDAAVDESRRIAQMQYDMGQITKEQLLQLERGFIGEKMRLDLGAADYEVSLYQNGTVEYEQAMQRRLEIKLKYQAQLSENKNATGAEGARPQLNFFSSAQSSMDTAMQAMITKQHSFAATMSNLYKGIGTAFIQEIVTKPLAAWIAGWARKIAMNMGFLTAENAQTATAAITKDTIAISSATTEIGANAAVAGSGAAASQASIPYVGPILAVAAMAAIFAAVMGMKGSMKSASRGFDIPKGMNPMVQAHAEEMILPANISNGLRGMIDGGGDSQQAGPVHLHLHTPDTAGARRFLMDNKAALADALRSAHRNGQR